MFWVGSLTTPLIAGVWDMELVDTQPGVSRPLGDGSRRSRQVLSILLPLLQLTFTPLHDVIQSMCDTE